MSYITSFIFAKETHFRTAFLVGCPAGRHICAVYKFSFTGGLTLHLGLIWLLLLPLDILLSEFIVHLSSLSFLSVFRWYSFRWFYVFLYIVPSSVFILYFLGSWQRLLTLAGYHLLFLVFRYMTLWPIWKSCVGKCSFLLFTLNCSDPSPCCILAALDIGSWVLTARDCRICIGDCNLCNNGVFLYIIRLLYKSVPSSLAL